MSAGAHPQPPGLLHTCFPPTHTHVHTQVFQQTGTLAQVVERLIADELKLASSATHEALDTSSLPTDTDGGGGGGKVRATPPPGGAGGPGGGPQRGPSKANAGVWKTMLWSRMDGLMEALSGKACEVWTLQRVLCRKRDAQTQQSFMELVAPSSPPPLAAASAGHIGDAAAAERERERERDARFFRAFWARLWAAVSAALQAAAEHNQFVRGMLTQDIARLRALLFSAARM